MPPSWHWTIIWPQLRCTHAPLVESAMSSANDKRRSDDTKHAVHPKFSPGKNATISLSRLRDILNKSTLFVPLMSYWRKRGSILIQQWRFCLIECWWHEKSGLITRIDMSIRDWVALGSWQECFPPLLFTSRHFVRSPISTGLPAIFWSVITKGRGEQESLGMVGAFD